MERDITLSSGAYSRLEKHAGGFDTPEDVIKRLLDYYESNYHSDDSPKKSTSRDFTKYTFQNQQYGKGRLVLAVVEDYVRQHVDISFEPLLGAFPKQLQGGGSPAATVVARLDDIDELYRGRKDDYQRRFFTKNSIKLASGEVVLVSNQWGVKNIGNFVDHARSLGYDISE